LENKEYSGMLHKALEGAVMLHTFPKTTVDVFALVLESGGSMILFTTLLVPCVYSTNYMVLSFYLGMLTYCPNAYLEIMSIFLLMLMTHWHIGVSDVLVLVN
jgi:hypothetical protein